MICSFSLNSLHIESQFSDLKVGGFNHKGRSYLLIYRVSVFDFNDGEERKRNDEEVIVNIYLFGLEFCFLFDLSINI